MLLGTESNTGRRLHVCKVSPALRQSVVLKKKKKKHAATAASCPTQMNASQTLQPIELSEPSGSGQSTVGSMSNSFSLSKVEDDKRAILTSVTSDSQAVDFAASKQVNFLTSPRTKRRTQNVLRHETKFFFFSILDKARQKERLLGETKDTKEDSRKSNRNISGEPVMETRSLV